jgi:hypothetical protein
LRFLKQSRRARVIAVALLAATVIGGGVLFVGGSASANDYMNVTFQHDETGIAYQVNGEPIYSDTTYGYAGGTQVGLGTSMHETGTDGHMKCFQQWVFQSHKVSADRWDTIYVSGQYGSWPFGNRYWNQATLSVPTDPDTDAFAVTADYAPC